VGYSMAEFLDSLGRKRVIEFERSYKEGWFILKMYNDKSTYGDCVEIPEEAFRSLISHGQAIARPPSAFEPGTIMIYEK